MKHFTLSFLLTCILTGVSFAQKPGDLDSSFGVNGKVITSHNGDRVRAIAIQDDGRIVVAAGNYSSRDFVVIRYLGDGSLDNSFGKKGIVVTDLGSKRDEGAKSVLIQNDGRIIVGGYTHIHDFALVRYEPNGELDKSFGRNGKSIVQFDLTGQGCESLAIEPDGKIVAAGASFFLLRFRQNGVPDSSFGENGLARADFGTLIPYAVSVTVQPDGKIIAAGGISNRWTNYNVALVRFHHDGRPDSSFGTDGKVITDLGSDEDATCVVKLKSGKILVAAGSTAGGSFLEPLFELVQYRSNGELDSSFGNNGTVLTYLGGNYTRSYFALPENGKILAGGYNGTGSVGAVYDIALVEYRSDGTIEPTFGTNGKVFTDIGRYDNAFAAAVQKDGKIVVGGKTDAGNVNEIALVRYYGHNILSATAKDNNLSNLQQQNNTSSTIHLSPNPVKDMLHIEDLSSSTKTISVLDVNGKLLQQAATANSSYSFNTKQLSAGIYFIRIDDGEKTATLKFIKE